MTYVVTDSKLCRFMHNPDPGSCETHITALKHLLRYLAGTVDYSYGLCYDFSTAWKDARTRSAICKESVYGMYDAYKSTGAYCFYSYYYYGGCVISWHTKLLAAVTTSTNHSEYGTAAKAARKARCTRGALAAQSSRRASLQQAHQLIKPIDWYSDSRGANPIDMTYNPAHCATTKHIALSDHYVREQQEEGVIVVSCLDKFKSFPWSPTSSLKHSATRRSSATASSWYVRAMPKYPAITRHIQRSSVLSSFFDFNFESVKT